MDVSNSTGKHSTMYIDFYAPVISGKSPSGMERRRGRRNNTVSLALLISRYYSTISKF